MPILKQEFNHNYEHLTTYKVERLVDVLTNTGTKTTSDTLKEVSKDLYLDLKSMLQQLPLDIGFDDTLNKFGIFGREYRIYAKPLTTNSNGVVVNGTGTVNNNSVIPFIFTQNNIDGNKSLRQIDSTSSVISGTPQKPGAGFLSNLFVDALKRTQTLYTIKLYYNTNFLQIQILSASREVINLLFVIEGYLSSQVTVKVVYECASPNNNYFISQDFSVYDTISANVPFTNWVTNLTTGNVTYHQLFKDNKPIIPTSNNTYTGPLNNTQLFGLDHILLARSKVLIPELVDITDCYVYEPMCLGGLVKFDNFLQGEPSLDTNKIYQIGSDNYYCPGDSSSDGCEALLPRTNVYPKFLLRI